MVYYDEEGYSENGLYHPKNWAEEIMERNDYIDLMTLIEEPEQEQSPQDSAEKVFNPVEITPCIDDDVDLKACIEEQKVVSLLMTVKTKYMML